MKTHYLSCPWNTSFSEWYKKWFYIREEPNNAMFCDVGYVPEKRVRWTDRLEYSWQNEELWTWFNGLAWTDKRWSGVLSTGGYSRARGGFTPGMSTKAMRTPPGWRRRGLMRQKSIVESINSSTWLTAALCQVMIVCMHTNWPDHHQR